MEAQTEDVAYLQQGRRRDRHEIIAEILKTAINGKVKTHIMYKARLSYAQLNEYLPKLVDKGLLEAKKVKPRKQEKVVYVTTKKGIALYEGLTSIDKLWEKESGSLIEP